MFLVPPAIDASGTLTFTPAPDAGGVALVFVQLRDNGGIANGGADTSPTHTLTITFSGVNDPPSFNRGPDVTVLQDVGSVVVPNWATALAAGPVDENGQALSFEVTASDPNLFSVQPAISPNGTLTFTPAGPRGTAVVTVRLRDDGGTAGGGSDVSPPQTFTITVTGLGFQGTPFEVWIAQVYLDLLEREVDPAALSFWTDQLEQDTPRTTVAAMILNSQEYRTRQIQRFFRQYLGHEASQGAVDFYLNGLAAGATYDEVKATILGSTEYIVRRGGTPAGYIDGLYLDLFGRSAPPEGLEFWGTFLQTTSPFVLALTMLRTPEADGTFVVQQYEALLDRGPNPNGGMDPFFVALQSGVRDESIIATMVASDEYFLRLRPNHNNLVQNQNWVAQIYADLLGRVPEPGAVGLWTDALSRGASRGGVARQIINSEEFRRKAINDIYLLLLNRPADESGTVGALQALGAGATFDQVKANVLGSAEYFFGHGGGSNLGFLSGVYADVLRFPLDQGGLAFWGPALASGTSRDSVALSLLTSDAADRVVVQTTYASTLRRGVDPVGLDFWTSVLQSGVRDEEFLARLVSTSEYYERFSNR
jgi:hypothetical protein